MPENDDLVRELADALQRIREHTFWPDSRAVGMCKCQCHSSAAWASIQSIAAKALRRIDEVKK